MSCIQANDCPALAVDSKPMTVCQVCDRRNACMYMYVTACVRCPRSVYGDHDCGHGFSACLLNCVTVTMDCPDALCALVYAQHQTPVLILMYTCLALAHSAGKFAICILCFELVHYALNMPIVSLCMT